MLSVWPGAISGQMACRRFSEQRECGRRPLGSCQVRPPPEHTSWVEVKSRPKKTRLRRRGPGAAWTAPAQGQRASSPPALQLHASSSGSGAVFSLCMEVTVQDPKCCMCWRGWRCSSLRPPSMFSVVVLSHKGQPEGNCPGDQHKRKS